MPLVYGGLCEHRPKGVLSEVMSSLSLSGAPRSCTGAWRGVAEINTIGTTQPWELFSLPPSSDTGRLEHHPKRKVCRLR